MLYISDFQNLNKPFPYFSDGGYDSRIHQIDPNTVIPIETFKKHELLNQLLLDRAEKQLGIKLINYKVKYMACIAMLNLMLCEKWPCAMSSVDKEGIEEEFQLLPQLDLDLNKLTEKAMQDLS